jgi:hypothetical protein
MKSAVTVLGVSGCEKISEQSGFGLASIDRRAVLKTHLHIGKHTGVLRSQPIVINYESMMVPPSIIVRGW